MNGPTDWIKRLSLDEHPEGGWFRRIYTADQSIESPHGSRPFATSIHYYLDRDQPIGGLHRNRSGILHFLQLGGPVEYLVVTADGALQKTVLGVEDGQALSLFVPGDCWKASRLVDDASHALVSEVVMPGFDYADHQFADVQTLRQECPQHLDALMPFLRSH